MGRELDGVEEVRLERDGRSVAGGEPPWDRTGAGPSEDLAPHEVDGSRGPSPLLERSVGHPFGHAEGNFPAERSDDAVLHDPSKLRRAVGGQHDPGKRQPARSRDPVHRGPRSGDDHQHAGEAVLALGQEVGRVRDRTDQGADRRRPRVQVIEDDRGG